MTPTPGVTVQDALARVLRWTSRRANRHRLYGSAAQELSQNEVSLLDAVAGPGQVRLSDLVAWQGVDKSTVTPQVRSLRSGDCCTAAVTPPTGGPFC